MTPIIEIAALCFVMVSGDSQFSSHVSGEMEQRSCQKYYADCFLKKKVINDTTKMQCISERETPEHIRAEYEKKMREQQR